METCDSLIAFDGHADLFGFADLLYGKVVPYRSRSVPYEVVDANQRRLREEIIKEIVNGFLCSSGRRRRQE